MNEGVEITKLVYQNRVKLCEETDRRILFILSQCKKNLIKINRP